MYEFKDGIKGNDGKTYCFDTDLNKWGEVSVRVLNKMSELPEDVLGELYKRYRESNRAAG